MRSFIVALFIFIIICVIITANAFYVIAKTDELLAICEEIEQSSSQSKVELLQSKWNSCRDIVALSVHRVDLEYAENAVRALCSYEPSSNDFKYYLSLAKTAFTQIANMHRFTVGSIF